MGFTSVLIKLGMSRVSLSVFDRYSVFLNCLSLAGFENSNESN